MIFLLNYTWNLDPEPSSVKNFIQPELADDNYDDDNIERITLEEVRTQLPFLKGASEEIIREFYELLNDSDMPSERRRQELVTFLSNWVIIFKLN